MLSLFRGRDVTADCNAAFRFSLISILALLFLLALHDAKSTDVESRGIDEAQPMLISLKINGQPASQTVLALQDRKGHWWLPVSELTQANVSVTDTSFNKFNDIDYVRADTLRVSDIRFDASKLSLDINFDPSEFEAIRLKSQSTKLSPAAPAAGAFLNYDLLAETSAGQQRYTAYTQLGAGIGPGVFISDQFLIYRPEQKEALRLDSSYTINNAEQIHSLRIGDSITRSSTLIGRPVRFGGLQWGTNFQIRPDLITLPVATLSGQSALPSTADLYVNNVLQSRQTLPPGPFSISTAPIVTGNGEVLLKLTDLSGQEQLITQSFYSSAALLAAGMSDYSLEVGALRNNFGFRSSDYGDALVAGSWRHGYSNRLTIEGAGSVQQNGLTGLQAGFVNATPELGVASVAVGFSHADVGTGAQIALGFERRSSHHSFSLRSQMASTDYRQTGVDADQTLRRLSSVFYGYQIDAIGNLGLSWMRQQRLNGEPLSISTASFSTRQTRWGSLIFSVTHLSSNAGNTSINLYWVLNLGGATSASASHSQSSAGQSQDVVQLQKSLPPGEGWGYRLQVAHNAPQQAYLYAQNLYGMVRAEAAEQNGQTSARLGIGGAVATLDGQWFLSRRIDSSFGLARMPGFPGVRVYVDNQFAARTNADGYALLPRLYPYIKNNVSVEQLDLPIDAQIESLKMHPVPAWRSGVLVDVPVKRVYAATLSLIQDNGVPIPAGATVVLLAEDGSERETFASGREGLVYLSGVEKDNHVRATWPNGHCDARISFQPEHGSVPYLGEFNCHRIERAQ